MTKSDPETVAILTREVEELASENQRLRQEMAGMLYPITVSLDPKEEIDFLRQVVLNLTGNPVNQV